MKKILAFVLCAVLLCTTLCVVSSAFQSEAGGTVWEVITPKSISFSWYGNNEVAVAAQGGSTLDALIDGDLVKDAAGFSTKGIVLFKDTYISKTYSETSAMVSQSKEDLSHFCFELNFGEKVSFDSVWFAIYHEIASDIGIPGDKAVIVETSTDGVTWSPIGDGTYYFNSSVGDYVGAGDQGVDECGVYLGKSYSSQYVRLSFTFMEVPEGGYWLWYNNTYEWCGFTEVGVSNYSSGKKPTVTSEEDVTVDPTAVEGTWIGDDGESTLIYTFTDNKGTKTLDIMEFDSAEYSELGTAAPLKAHDVKLAYSVLATTLTITYSKKDIQDIEAVIDEDGQLILGTGKNAIAFTAYEEPEDVAITGTYFIDTEDEENITVVTINTSKIVTNKYVRSEYEASGAEATPTETDSKTYTLRGDNLTLKDGSKYTDYKVSLDESGNILFDGSIVYYAPVAEEPTESSEETEETSEEIAESSEEVAESSEEASETTEEPAESTEEPAESSEVAESSDASASTGSFPIWLIIVIVAVVVVVVVVVVIVVGKKKK